MKMLKILKYPDKRLRIKAKPVKKINYNIQKIINKMFKIMKKKNGIGLAATQINIHLQIIVIEKLLNINTPMVLINPKIIKKKGKIKFEERCLSIPNKKGIITRSKIIKVSTLNYFGKKYIFQAKSILSICIQHEIDHLIGKLFIDYI
ncbi:peptide deformylase [Buchnera aphidicola]|uniref:peptide deformylase n=1 Tax=Buchnera aphidicola TaxID=9 RepID=UPI0031B81FDF